MTSSTDTLLQKINPEAAQKAAAAKAAKSKYPLINALRSDAFKKELALALPKTLTADRMARVLLTECRKNPALLDCELPSVQSCIMQAAQLGLEPGSALGHAYLIPFNTKKNGEWHKECQLIIGYRGMLDLCRRSGQIQSVNAYCVHEGDDFSYQLGLHPDIHHVPAATAKPGAMTYVYAVVQLKDGGTQFEVMSRAEIEAIRNNSQGYKQAVSNAQKWKSDIRSPWATNFEEMARKTVIRRMFKYLPMSIEAAQAVENDERADRGESPADFIDGIWSEKDEADISALEDLRDEAERIPEAVAAPAEKAPVKVAEPA